MQRFLNRFISSLLASSLLLFSSFASSQEMPINESKELQAHSVAPNSVLLEGIQFFYKLDSDTRFLERRSQWEQKSKGLIKISLQALEEMAYKAYDEASAEKPFDIWREQGGPNPLVFRPKIHVRNNTDQAWLNVKIEVIWRAKIGDLLADPELLLTDYDNLSDTAKWENLFIENINVDVLSPGEDKLVELSPFQLFFFLSLYKNKWPEFLELEANLQSADGQSFGTLPEHQAIQALPMIPDHFVVPIHNKRRLSQ